MLFLNIATGVILVLLGMRYVRKGLDRLFGSQLVDWLQQMTNNRYRAFFAGIVAGTIAPSSSAIAMLSVQMLNQTALSAGRMLAVVLGANVGITVSVQLLAFRLQDYAGVFLLAGGLGFLFLKRAIFRGAGQMLLGLGLVFLAMGIISSAGTAAAANADLKLLFSVVDHYPVVVFVGTALLTVALQSSTASIGLSIGLAESGLLPGTTIVPWVLGANLGITLTMMIAGWGSMEGRRLAIGSLLIKGCGALAILLGSTPLFVFILNVLPGAIDRQAANLNTFFNLILGLAALPVLSPISRVLAFLIESQPIDDSREPDSYLDPLLLQAPSLALNQAAREELRLLDEIKLMLRAVWMMIWGKNVRLVSKVEEHQRRIEDTQEELKDYLSQVSDENLGEEDVGWKFIVMDYSQELTAIGTLIKRDLCDAAIRQIHMNQEPSPEDKAELEAFYTRTLERIERAAALLMSPEPHLAEEFIREKEQINAESRRSRKTRLEKPLPVQNASSNVVDMIDCLRRINSQLTAIGYAIVRDSTRSDETLVHSPQTQVEGAWPPEDSLKQEAKSPAIKDR
ncbi:MAG TPA: Na/Pi cotransporter family protein [Chthoniobacterales bacterium]|nr:Na/Pi cotransporter family protein [Chthoniobacterales bacterium]